MSTKKYLGVPGTQEVFSKILNNQITGFKSAIGTGNSGRTGLLLYGINKKEVVITEPSFELFNIQDFNFEYDDQEDILRYNFWNQSSTIHFRDKFIRPIGSSQDLILGNGMMLSINDLFSQNLPNTIEHYLPSLTIEKKDNPAGTLYTIKRGDNPIGEDILIPKLTSYKLDNYNYNLNLTNNLSGNEVVISIPKPEDFLFIEKVETNKYQLMSRNGNQRLGEVIEFEVPNQNTGKEYEIKKLGDYQYQLQEKDSGNISGDVINIPVPNIPTIPEVSMVKNNDFSYSLHVGGTKKGSDIIIPREVIRPGFEVNGNAVLTTDHQNSVVFVNSGGTINLSNLQHLSSVSFRKVFEDTNQPISFVCDGKNIIYTNLAMDDTSNKLSGKNGSTATVSVYGSNCYIDIRNIK